MAARERLAARAFTMVELAVVGAIIGVVAAAAMFGANELISRARDRDLLEQLFHDVQQQRSTHIARGDGRYLILTATGSALSFQRADDPANLRAATSVGQASYAVQALGLDCGGQVNFDAVGRCVDAPRSLDEPAPARDCTLSITMPGGGKVETMTFSGGGAVTTSFGMSQSQPPAGAKLRDVSSLKTPKPTALGDAPPLAGASAQGALLQ